MNALTIGKGVWWDDPSGKGSGPYVVKEIWNDEEGLYDTTMIHISNNKYEADVSAGELQDLEHRRKCISDFVAKVTDIAEEDDWQVHNYDEKFDKVDLDFSKYSSLDQDFSFNIICQTGSVNEFLETIERFYDDFDPSEEASKWLGPDGHGTNGAPYDLEALLDDMKECKENVKNLLNLYKRVLKGIKSPAPIRHFQFSERLYNIRQEIIGCIVLTLKEILQKTNEHSLLWHTITNGNDPDICYETDSGVCDALPALLALGEKDDEFGITFASYCDCLSSTNGENLYTDTLIDILEYLENYRAKL